MFLCDTRSAGCLRTLLPLILITRTQALPIALCTCPFAGRRPVKKFTQRFRSCSLLLSLLFAVRCASVRACARCIGDDRMGSPVGLNLTPQCLACTTAMCVYNRRIVILLDLKQTELGSEPQMGISSQTVFWGTDVESVEDRWCRMCGVRGSRLGCGSCLEKDVQ